MRIRVRHAFVRIGKIDPAELRGDTRIADLPWDSLTSLEVAMDIEDAFEVEIPEHTLDSFETAGDVIRYLVASLGLD